MAVSREHPVSKLRLSWSSMWQTDFSLSCCISSQIGLRSSSIWASGQAMGCRVPVSGNHVYVFSPYPLLWAELHLLAPLPQPQIHRLNP